jgi:uncharacterized Zn finger protein (UPF0148 family)
MAKVTCTTQDCPNQGVTIELDADGTVFCGPCGQEITNKG